MRLIGVALAAVATLAACAEQAPPAAPPPDASAPGQTEPEQRPPAPTDACGAAESQGLIGRSRSDLPPTRPAGANWRIFETGQPVNHDLRPDRLNIEIDPDSQTVIRLACG